MTKESTGPMERKWYYAVDGVRHGPVALEELRALVQSATVRPSDLVWQPEFGSEWRTVGQVPTLSEPTAFAQVPPILIAGHQAPLLGVVGERPSWFEAVCLAFSGMVERLFKPFDITRWCGIGFCAWLAYLGTQAMYNYNASEKKTFALTAVKHEIDAALDKWVSLPHHPTEITTIGIAIVVGLVFALWMCALRSRGDFMFVHRWYKPDASIRLCWQMSRTTGRELFVWRLYFFLISSLLFALNGFFAFTTVVKPYMDANKMWNPALMKPVVLCVTVAVFLSIGVQIVAHLTKAFAVPVMYWQGVTVQRAWLVVFALCNQYPLAVLAYLLCGMACGVLAVCAVIVAVLLTCCVGIVPLAVPYVGTVILLPIFLFFRGYALCFLSQWRSDLIPAAARDGQGGRNDSTRIDTGSSEERSACASRRIHASFNID